MSEREKQSTEYMAGHGKRTYIWLLLYVEWLLWTVSAIAEVEISMNVRLARHRPPAISVKHSITKYASVTAVTEQFILWYQQSYCAYRNFLSSSGIYQDLLYIGWGFHRRHGSHAVIWLGRPWLSNRNVQHQFKDGVGAECPPQENECKVAKLRLWHGVDLTIIS